ncbi:phosphoribosyltransferase [Oricola sp.]|uniref:phosphoribosyltransferase n=1 Tax=Oricola sp. TaxID=1979950 RepID=UPI0025FA497B|nr:phosphoribosyltransferase [Oricola sp.]MCI5076465.1 phosphoribosyltransferase [Oricola sp.]
MLFLDREDAGRKLAELLKGRDYGDAVVVALPRGGVPLGAVVADALNLPLDVILVRKVGAPSQPELALGAVTDGDTMKLTVNREIQAELGLTDEDVEDLARAQLPEIERRRASYYKGRAPVPLAGKTVIVVDDGVATGATLNSALRLIRGERPSRLILALPVAPRDTLERLREHADEVVCLHAPSPFLAVGAHYADFSQVSDEEVVRCLERARNLDGGQ